ncbi:MAG: TrkH family potassium uptake protein [Cyanobacteria bacterium SIG26]|nr:TrkH family potassium uptake protein [Cyanobacteria bacterium SIG26]
MRLSYVSNALSLILTDIGFVTFIPTLLALYYKDYNSILPFVIAGILALLSGIIFKYFVNKKSSFDSLNDIKRSEALMIVSLSWITVSIIAAIPYLFFGFSPINALFEGVSGITATGATILERFDYPKALLFWRSFTQWLGGMGIIVLFVAILPQFAVAGRQMFFAEAPGPTEDKFTPRIKNTASALWIIYAIMTLLCALSLWFAGMNPFDAICNAFSTLSAGGFSPHAYSIAGYNSKLICWIIIFFMFTSGASFVLQSRALTRRKLSLFWKSEEFRYYTIILLLLSSAVCAILYIQQNYNILDAITASVYQVLSLATSTGSASENFQLWTLDAKILLFITMFASSCSGSAGGGLKISRWILIFKYIKNELYKILHPKAVLTIKLDNKVVAPEVIRQTIFFAVCFFGLWAITAILLAVIEQNFVLGLTASISAIGDIGPGLGDVVGPMGNYSTLKPLSKLIFIFDMLIGRLEIIPFLVLFHKDFWNIK